MVAVPLVRIGSSFGPNAEFLIKPSFDGRYCSLRLDESHNMAFWMVLELDVDTFAVRFLRGRSCEYASTLYVSEMVQERPTDVLRIVVRDRVHEAFWLELKVSIDMLRAAAAAAAAAAEDASSEEDD